MPGLSFAQSLFNVITVGSLVTKSEVPGQNNVAAAASMYHRQLDDIGDDDPTAELTQLARRKLKFTNFGGSSNTVDVNRLGQIIVQLQSEEGTPKTKFCRAILRYADKKHILHPAFFQAVLLDKEGEYPLLSLRADEIEQLGKVCGVDVLKDPDAKHCHAVLLNRAIRDNDLGFLERFSKAVFAKPAPSRAQTFVARASSFLPKFIRAQSDPVTDSQSMEEPRLINLVSVLAVARDDAQRAALFAGLGEDGRDEDTLQTCLFLAVDAYFSAEEKTKKTKIDAIAFLIKQGASLDIPCARINTNLSLPEGTSLRDAIDRNITGGKVLLAALEKQIASDAEIEALAEFSAAVLEYRFKATTEYKQADDQFRKDTLARCKNEKDTTNATALEDAHTEALKAIQAQALMLNKDLQKRQEVITKLFGNQQKQLDADKMRSALEDSRFQAALDRKIQQPNISKSGDDDKRALVAALNGTVRSVAEFQKRTSENSRFAKVVEGTGAASALHFLMLAHLRRAQPKFDTMPASLLTRDHNKNPAWAASAALPPLETQWLLEAHGLNVAALKLDPYSPAEMLESDNLAKLDPNNMQARAQLDFAMFIAKFCTYEMRMPVKWDGAAAALDVDIATVVDMRSNLYDPLKAAVFMDLYLPDFPPLLKKLHSLDEKKDAGYIKELLQCALVNNSKKMFETISLKFPMLSNETFKKLIDIGFAGVDTGVIDWEWISKLSEKCYIQTEGAPQKLGSTIFSACKADNFKNFAEYLDLMIKLGADLSVRDGKNEISLLHQAAEKGDLEKVMALCDRDAYISACDTNGKTPLHYAAEQGSAAVCEFLLERGASVDCRDDADLSPLQCAVMTNKAAAAIALLAGGADVMASDTKTLSTPLHHAAKQGFVDLVKILLAEKNIDVTAQDVTGMTALHHAAMGPKPKYDVIRLLVKKGADIFAENDSGESALSLLQNQLIVASSIIEEQEALLEKATTPVVDAALMRQQTDTSVGAKQFKFIRSATSRSAAVPQRSPEEIARALAQGKIDAQKSLIKNITDLLFCDVVRQAVGAEQITEFLVHENIPVCASGANKTADNQGLHGIITMNIVLIDKALQELKNPTEIISLRDEDGKTPMDLASPSVRKFLEGYLFKKKGWTPLHCAAINGDAAYVQEVLNRKPFDPTMFVKEDKDGNIPKRLVASDNVEVLKIIEAALEKHALGENADKLEKRATSLDGDALWTYRVGSGLGTEEVEMGVV